MFNFKTRTLKKYDSEEQDLLLSFQGIKHGIIDIKESR